MFKVLISDPMSNVAEQIFEEKNISVDVIIGLSEEEMIKSFQNMTAFLLDQPLK